MCKIIILQKHAPAQRNRMIRAAWSYFSRSGETDGFGAAWIGRDGRLGWAKSSAPELSGDLPAWADGFFAHSGLDARSDGGWLLLHGRTATCGVDVDNTHPMLDDNGTAALIHNGVVSSDTLQNVYTTCDSELLLHAWDQGGAKGLEQVSGYFAFALLLRRRDGWHAVVARDDKARLRVGRSRSGWAWGTTDEALATVGAEPVGDHGQMRAAVFTPDGAAEVQTFQKGQEARELSRKWAVASGAYRADALDLWRAGS